MTPPNRLKELREAKGVSQKELAHATGQSWTTVNRHERGSRRIRAHIMQLYARYFGVDPVELFVKR